MSVQQELAKYVREQHINPRELALSCGWSVQKLSCILRCTKKVNTVDYGILCEALHVSYDYFYDRSKQHESTSE